MILNTNINNYRKPISSIFFGGGTPSLFNPETFKKIITKIQDRFELKKNCEITIEANPGTLDKEFFYGYKDIGINRMSLGIQSFNQKHLTKLERIHDQQEAIESASLAVKLFDNVNIDLMFALPEQTKLELNEDIYIDTKTDLILRNKKKVVKYKSSVSDKINLRKEEKNEEDDIW